MAAFDGVHCSVFTTQDEATRVSRPLSTGEPPLTTSSRSARHGGRILHATEALAAGVGLSLARLAALQAEAGVTPTVVGLRRYDTPGDDELRRWFGPDVELVLYPRADAARARQLAWLTVQLLRLLASGRFEVLHLHSSFAGAVGRVVAAPFAGRVRTFYSPHGFAFLRSDLRRSQRRLVHAAERLLAALPGRLVLVSPSESEVAASVSRRTSVLQNGVDLQRLAAGRAPVDGGCRAQRPTVVMIGRITEQKAPWRFAEAARRLTGEARFQWLGYGPAEDVERWLGDAPVEVSGRLDHDSLLAALRTADLVYFPTLWEGMPLSLIEAQASGLPVVASDIEGNRDVVLDGRTGLLRDGEEELLKALRSLVVDPERRARMAAEARVSAQRFSDRDRGTRSFEIYGLGPVATERPSAAR